MSESYVVIFLLAGEAYCIPVASVQEIQGYHSNPPPRPVPDTSSLFEGIIDLRGQVMPILDLQRRFGLGQVTPSRKTCYIIVDTGPERIGLLVDAVLEVQRVNDQSFHPPPARMKLAASRDCVVGVGKLPSKSDDREGERLVVLLDVERLMSEPARPAV
ncbi:MAG: chemotaxis protein CheW [Candidatus Sericytochromatia bacterium]